MAIHHDEDETDIPRTSQLYLLARHIIDKCPRLRLQGLMTIGSLSESLSGSDENRDFEVLRRTGNALELMLREDDVASPDLSSRVGGAPGGKLLLSMGMSSDFEAALRAGSDIVRVGTGIFGERQMI